MKKVIALALALVLALSLASVAFATFPDTGATGIVAGTNTGIVADITVDGTAPTAPGETLKLEILDAAAAEFANSTFADYVRFGYSAKKGSFSGVAIKKATTGEAYVEVKLADTFKADEVDYKLELTFTDRKTDGAYHTAGTTAGNKSTFTLEGTGKYAVITVYNDEEVEMDIPDDTKIVDFKPNENDRVAYTFNIVSDNGSDVATLTWTARESGKKFLGFETKTIADINSAYGDVDLEFLNFKGNPSFNATAKLFINSTFSDGVVYQVVDGKLVAVDAKYSASKKGFELTTKVLGNYVIAAKDLGIKAETEPTDSTKTNPGTGSNGFINVAVVAAVVSLAAAGAVSLKK